MQTALSPIAKTDRNSEIIRRVIEGKGTVTLQAVANDYGLTRARIQKIVGDAGISMRAMKKAQRKPIKLLCGVCGQLYLKGSYSEHCAAVGHRRLVPPGEKVERNNRILAFYADGYNTSEIAEHFGVPQPVVSRILHRKGIRAMGRRARKGGLKPNAAR
jgi:plasmid maintenance system antidote protein VapI